MASLDPLCKWPHAGRSMALPGQHVFGISAVVIRLIPPFTVTPYPTFIYPHLIKTGRPVLGQTEGQELDGFGMDVDRNAMIFLGRMHEKIHA